MLQAVEGELLGHFGYEHVPGKSFGLVTKDIEDKELVKVLRGTTFIYFLRILPVSVYCCAHDDVMQPITAPCQRLCRKRLAAAWRAQSSARPAARYVLSCVCMHAFFTLVNADADAGFSGVADTGGLSRPLPSARVCFKVSYFAHMTSS